MKKFTKMFLSCAAVAALTAAVATSAMAADVQLKGGLAGTYNDVTGMLTITKPTDMTEDATKEATLLVYDADADVTKLEGADADKIVGIDQAAKAEFANAGLKGTPTEAGGKKYVVALGYYDKAGAFKIAKGNLFGVNVMIGDATLNGKVNVDDATAIIKHSAKIKLLEGDALEAADANGNSKVNVDDATCVIKFAAKLTTGIGNITGK